MRAVAIMVLAAFFGGCAPKTPQPKPSPSSTTSPVKSTAFNATLKLRIAGAETIERDLKTQMLATEIFRNGVPPSTYFMSVGVAPQVELPDGRKMVVAFDLRPGKWRGNGAYTLDESSTQVRGEDLPSPFTDHAFVQLLRIGDAASGVEVKRFEKLVEPCKVRISRSGLKADLQCPKLADASGAEISLVASWDGKPAASPVS